MNKDNNNNANTGMGKPDAKRATIQDQEEGPADRSPSLDTSKETTHLVNPGVGNPTPGSTVKG